MQGKIVRWNEERGFGFVQEDITKQEIFIHISSLNVRTPPPEIGEKIEFETLFNEKKGKTEVKKAVYLDRIAPLSINKERKKYSQNRKSYPQKTDNAHNTMSEKSMIGWLLLIAILIVLVLSYFFVFKENNQNNIVDKQGIVVHSVPSDNSDEIHRLFIQQQNDVFVTGRGKVKKILPDDNNGLRHQKFILQLSNGQTLLVAHNIDLADRLPNLQKGDEVSFAGDYVYNNKGGLIHWTHKDPRGQHKDGYLMYQGKIYQ